MRVDLNFSMRAKAALVGAAALSFFAMTNAASAVTLVEYDFNGNAGNEVFERASFSAANLVGLDFERGSGLNRLAGANSFSSSGWSAYSSSPNDYLTFGLSALSGYTATINQLVFSSRSSNTGPGDLALLAAVNGGTFQQISTFTHTNDNVVNRTLNFTPLTDVSNVIFRIVASSSDAANGGTLATGGTFRVQNFGGTPNSPFSINGSVLPTQVAAAVPEPAAWACMIGGFGMIGGTLRRKRKVTTRVQFA